MSRFQFVADHHDTFEVKRLCQLVEVARSSYYAWAAGAPARSQRAAADEVLAARIRRVHAVDATYGAPRVTAELNDGAPAGERVNHKRVARVMRTRHLAGVRLRRKVRTTIPEPANQVMPDLLERDFTAQAPNIKYVGDITYLPCGAGGFLYLATVIDCYLRRLVGWSIAEHMRTDLVRVARVLPLSRCRPVRARRFCSSSWVSLYCRTPMPSGVGIARRYRSRLSAARWSQSLCGKTRAWLVKNTVRTRSVVALIGATGVRVRLTS